MNQAFLDKITSTVLENLENEQFGVEELSDQIGISRSHLHRKLKLLKGKSVSQFIREVRLEEAMKLLRRNVATTSEIAYRVGFNSPGYFHRCFKSHYGYSPGDLKHQETFEKPSPETERQDINTFDKKPTKKPFPVRWVTTVLLVIITGLIVWQYINDQSWKPDSLAVLPIQNFTGDPEQDYFVYGFQDQLIGALGQIPSIRVISRTSMMRYKSIDTLSLKEIARELGVDAIIEGSVTGRGENINIELHLIEVFPDERHVWSQRYEQNLANIAVLQNDIVTSVAREIHAEWSQNGKLAMASVEEVDPEAYKAYLRGRFHWDKLTESDLDLAMKYFELARDLDPDFALAYSGISLVWMGRLQQGLASYTDGAAKMKIGALKALQLDSSLSEVHFVLGAISCWGEWKYLEAERLFKKAIALNPNNSAAQAYLSHVLNILQKEGGSDHMNIALKLDPFNPLYQALYGMCLMHTRQFDMAIDSLGQSIKNNPSNPVALSTLRTAYHMKGMYPEALEVWITSYALKEDEAAVSALISGNQGGGYSKALESLAELLIARSDTMYVTPWQIATLYTRAGNVENAIDWLEKAFVAHDNNMPYLGVDPIFDVLKDEPRFHDLLDRMNLQTR